jgi:hypothetical protein
MSADYPYQEELDFLNFRILWHTNYPSLMNMIWEQFLSPDYRINSPVTDTFNFFIRYLDEDNEEISWNTALNRYYDSQQEILRLTYLNGAISVEVDYRVRQVRATIMKQALNYQWAIGNWVLTIPLSELMKLHDLYLMHSACLVSENQGVLFAGKSGIGKTTLTLGLLSMGWQAISDDEVFLTSNSDLVAYSGPEKAKISWSSWRRFQYYLGQQSRFNSKKLVNLEDYFPGQILDSYSISAICFIEQSDRTSILKLQPIESFRRMLSVGFLTSEPQLTRKNSDFLYSVSQQIPAYLLRVGLDVKALHQKLTEIVLH